MKNFTRCIKSLALFVGLIGLSFNASAATILSETFSTSLGNFTTQSLVGDQVWLWNSYAYARMTGYVSSVNNPNDDWLISPSMDFSDVTKANLSFEHAHRYGVNVDAELSLMVTDSYTGGTIDTTKWISVAFVHSDQTTWTFVNSGLLALDAFAGKENVRFAFRYKSSSTAGATWEIKNVLVESVVESAQTVVLEEKFDNFTAGTLASPSGTDVATSLDTYTSLPGWTGSKVYSAAGTIKMGTSSVLGYITTPAINLSANSGKFSISLDLRAWSGDSASINILVNDVLAKKLTGLSNAAAPYVLSTFGPFEFTGGTATTKITLSGLQAAKGRFFLDNLKITQGGAPIAIGSLTSAKFKIMSGTTISKDITLKATNLTGDLTVALTNKSGTAFSTTVTIVTAAQAMAEAGYVIPVKYTPTVAGKDTAIVSVTGGGFEIPVTSTITGISFIPVEVANLGVLRAAYDADITDKETIYKVTGEVLVSYSYFSISGNTNYVQDATGGTCIYDVAKIITDTLSIGDGITGLTGSLDTYGGLMEFLPFYNISASSNDNPINSTVLSIPETKANKDRYESTLVRVFGLTTLSTDSLWKETRTSYNFVSGTDTIVVRTNYTGLDYMGKVLPKTAVNIQGLLIEYNGVVQLVPRSLTDFNEISSLQEVSKRANVYGSNGILNVEANQGQVIEVYNILGRKVISAVASEGTNTFNIGRNQMFIVKAGNSISKIVL